MKSVTNIKLHRKITDITLSPTSLLPKIPFVNNDPQFGLQMMRISWSLTLVSWNNLFVTIYVLPQF